MNEEDGSMMVLDLLGVQSAERDDRQMRQNAVTGSSFLWEQEAFQPVTREIHCHMSLMSGKQVGAPSCLHGFKVSSAVKVVVQCTALFLGWKSQYTEYLDSCMMCKIAASFKNNVMFTSSQIESNLV